MSALRFPKWQKPCEDALLEADPEKLFLRVLVAETAIFHCLHDSKISPGNIELRAMDDMLKHFQRLLTNSFTIPEGAEAEAQLKARRKSLGKSRKQNPAEQQSQPSA